MDEESCVLQQRDQVLAAYCLLRSKKKRIWVETGMAKSGDITTTLAKCISIIFALILKYLMNCYYGAKYSTESKFNN